MIKVGQKVQIDPFRGIRITGMADLQETFEGIINFVHPTHHWFNVKYTDNAGTRLVGFRFDDIGKTVELI